MEGGRALCPRWAGLNQLFYKCSNFSGRMTVSKITVNTAPIHWGPARATAPFRLRKTHKRREAGATHASAFPPSRRRLRWTHAAGPAGAPSCDSDVRTQAQVLKSAPLARKHKPPFQPPLLADQAASEPPIRCTRSLTTN